MLPARIEDATRYLGAPKGWHPDTDGDCVHLAVRDEVRDGLPIMHSAWEPTPEELALLNAGARVYLSVVGTGHPPVALWVGDPASETPAT